MKAMNPYPNKQPEQTGYSTTSFGCSGSSFQEFSDEPLPTLDEMQPSQTNPDGNSRSGPYTQWRNKLQNKLQAYHFDSYSVEPLYQWKPISSSLSKAVTLINLAMVLAYVSRTMILYVKTPPSLVNRSTYNIPVEADVEVYDLPMLGFSVRYEDRNGDSHMLTAQNRDRYFSFEIIATNRTKEPSLCLDGSTKTKCKAYIDPEEIVSGEGIFSNYERGTFSIDPAKSSKYSIQGDFVQEKYSYLNFVLNRCVNNTEDISLATATNNPPITCASPEEITQVVQSGEVQVGLIVQSQSFDPEQYHQSKDPLKPSYSSWRWFLQPGLSLQREVYMKPRQVESKDWQSEVGLGFQDSSQQAMQYLDAPTVLGYNRPIGGDIYDQTEYLEFFVRMDKTGTKSEIVYDHDIFTLLSLWGAFYSFLATFTLGTCARMYNNYVFKRHFKKSAKAFAQKGHCEEKKGAAELFVERLFSAAAGLTDDEDLDFGKRMSLSRGLVDMTELEIAQKKSKQGTAARKIFKQMHCAFNDMDLRLMDAKNIDRNGNLTITPEELLHPTSVFGELRIMALLEHAKKQDAATKISAFYRKHVKKSAPLPGDDIFSKGAFYVIKRSVRGLKKRSVRSLKKVFRSSRGLNHASGGHEEALSKIDGWQPAPDDSADNQDAEGAQALPPCTEFGSPLDVNRPLEVLESQTYTTADLDSSNERQLATDASSINWQSGGAQQPPPETNVGSPMDVNRRLEVPEQEDDDDSVPFQGNRDQHSVDESTVPFQGVTDFPGVDFPEASSYSQQSKGTQKPSPETNFDTPLDSSGPSEEAKTYTPTVTTPDYDPPDNRQLATEVSLADQKENFEGAQQPSSNTYSASPLYPNGLSEVPENDKPPTSLLEYKPLNNGQQTTGHSPDNQCTERTVPDSPKNCFDEFFRFSYHYGEAAAYQYYGEWSPPPGTPNPYGENPGGITTPPAAFIASSYSGPFGV